MSPADEFRRNYQFGTFVIWPPVDVRLAVGALRQRFDPASQAICGAHITLTQPFAREPTRAELDAIERRAAGHPALEVTFGPLSTFLPFPCVYLVIQPAEPLRSLRAGLHDLGLFNLSLPFSEPSEFIPHMSITDGYPDAEQTRQIFDALRGSEPTGTFRATSIAWIRSDSAFHFDVIQTFALGR